MRREYYSANLDDFLSQPVSQILGILTENSEFPVENTQRDAWLTEIRSLQNVLTGKRGKVYFEYAIPRMGKRIDVLLIIKSVIFILEFKIGETDFLSSGIDQVWDYALDLKYFHETSHDKFIIPVLIASRAKINESYISLDISHDKVLIPVKSNLELLPEIINKGLLLENDEDIIISNWEKGSYKPTPTIIEAAMALYHGHSVNEISRSDADAKNLSTTSQEISEIIKRSNQDQNKSICFVTGVPGAGKTLVGLNIATQHIDKEKDLYSVFLSGNGPLVQILREALARDKVHHEKELGKKSRLIDARREVKLFIQNVHNFRDECLLDSSKPPLEHVALFDEAQRAWNIEQTSNFMKRKKGVADFNQSEPDFLISCLDRHPDWSVIVCLVGGGQEINTGEAGISEWINSINSRFQSWKVYISPKLLDSEYGAGQIIQMIDPSIDVVYNENLHLSTSIRSFRSEKVSLLVKQILDIDIREARKTLLATQNKYPIVITRDLQKAKAWLKKNARGSERYGIVVSSQALRLKPLAVDAKATIDPIHWFLDTKEDVRSSYYLEDVATEFQIQGLELDWSCVIWDGDFRFAKDHWECRSFCGSKWNQIRKEENKAYLKNAYRVLLTRARQGMVIVIPKGDEEDPTRKAEYYDPVYQYLIDIGFPVI